MKACGLVIVFIFGILLSMIGPKMSRKLELDADRLALETMCDLQSAESGLKHLIEASERPSLALKDTTQPSLEKRIKALRETALRLGLDVPKDDV
jgi:Zn-dependent protease with chaperone function